MLAKHLQKTKPSLWKFVATLTSTRRDKILDRLAIMPPEAVSAEQLLSRLNGVKVEFEDDVIDAEVQDEKASS